MNLVGEVQSEIGSLFLSALLSLASPGESFPLAYILYMMRKDPILALVDIGVYALTTLLSSGASGLSVASIQLQVDMFTGFFLLGHCRVKILTLWLICSFATTTKGVHASGIWHFSSSPGN